MKKFKVCIFLFSVFLLLGHKTSAQALVLSNDPQVFITDFQSQLEKYLGAGVKPNLSEFASNYKSKYNAEGQKKVISLIQYLTKRGIKPIEIYSLVRVFKGIETNQSHISGDALGGFADNLRLTLENQIPKKINEIIASLDLLLNQSMIYNSNFNKVYLSKTKVDFRFFGQKQDYFNPIITAAAPVQKEEEEDIGWGEQISIEEYDPWNDPNLNVANKPFVNSLEEINLPRVEGLVCTFENVTLSLTSPSDSINIVATSGAYDFLNNNLVGTGGKIIWNLTDGQAKATLDQYSYKTTGSKMIAEQVSLAYSGKMKNTVKGVLELKLEKRAQGQASSYPRFKSYRNDADLILKINNYEYKGGISLLGEKLFSASLLQPFATLLVNKGIKNTFQVQSRNFAFSDSTIVSDRVSFVTRFDSDSISHPAVKMRFDLNQNILILSKVDKGGFRNSMYSDTFHQVDIRCDVVYWPLNGGKMDFSIVSAKNEISAVFESFNYYNPDRIRYLSKAASFNPLILAGNIVARKRENSLTVQEMVDLTKKEKYIVSNGMLIGSQMGFFDYDPIKNIYSLSRKGQHYFLSFMGKADFDDLVLSSLSSGAGSNASIDIESKSLDIIGTQDFKLSDSLGINFKPKDAAMQIVGNKIFTFNGEISVKNFKFYGDFEVQYEQFLVKLKRIDSITFVPLELFNKGINTYIGGNYLYGKTGTLYLNSPDNKSGRKVLKEYPKLDIPGGVLVYFNENGRNEKFNSEVFFKNTNLKLDSLNAVNPVFDGVFNSGGIFKPIQENLKVMPDVSMGISHKARVPYKLYGGETSVKTDSNIILDKRGIKTSGEVNHLAGKLKTKNIKFYTDHLVAEGESGKIAEMTIGNVYFPDVNISDYKMYWDSKVDSMAIASEKGFEFYKNSSQLKGSLVLKSKGLFGNGIMDRVDSDVKSENFKFNKPGFLAENANFNIKSTEENAKPVFSSQFVGIDFNVVTSIVKISAQKSDFNNLSKSLLSFPFSSYTTTIDNASWNIKDKKISMSGLLENSVFKSTSPTQYGLKFNGTAATYDILANNLNVSGVEGINSVDAFIVPNKGLVAVQKDGTLSAFTNSKIIADTLNKYHVMTNASVKINSKLSYSGSADYQFVNVSADTFNIKLGSFEFAEISADGTILNSKGSNKLSTIAKAKISEKDGLYLSPKILYRGDMTMLAPFKNLSLNGSVLPDLKKYPMLGGNWINYSGNKSEAISINVDNTLKDGGKPLFVGLHFKSGVLSDAMYPTFLSAKKSEDDLDIFKVSGVFKRDEPNKKFVITPINETPIGNRYEFYDEKGIIAMEGKFNLLGAESKIFETVGIGNVMLDSMKYNFSTMLKFEFPISIPTTQKMGQNIVKSNLDAGNSDPAIVPTSEEFLSKLGQYVGQKDADDYTKKSQKEHIPLHKYSTKFLSTLVLSDVTLKWNPIANAYHSVGRIGISNIGDVDINAMTEGYVEIVKSPLTGDELSIFIEISPNSWYYFGYKGGQLGISSADEELNKLVSTPITGKEKKSEATFVDAAEAMKFRKKFLQIYRGMKETDFAKKPTGTNTIPTLPNKKSPTKKAEEKEGF